MIVCMLLSSSFDTTGGYVLHLISGVCFSG